MKVSKGFVFSSLAAICWAISIVLARYILSSGESALNLAFWTSILATPFWGFLLYQNRKEAKKLSRAGIMVLLGMGFNGLLITIIEPYAIQYSTATSYSFLIRMIVPFTILFAFLFIGEKITRKKVVLIVLTLLGAYLLTTKGQLTSFSLGDTLTIIEAMLIAFGNNVLGKLSTKSMSANVASSASFMTSTLPLAALVPIQGSLAIPSLPLLVAILTASYIAISVFRFRAYREASASYVTMVFSFTPVCVALLTALFLKESMTPVQIVGGACMVLAGVAAEKLRI